MNNNKQQCDHNGLKLTPKYSTTPTRYYSICVIDELVTQNI